MRPHGADATRPSGQWQRARVLTEYGRSGRRRRQSWVWRQRPEQDARTWRWGGFLRRPSEWTSPSWRQDEHPRRVEGCRAGHRGGREQGCRKLDGAADYRGGRLRGLCRGPCADGTGLKELLRVSVHQGDGRRTGRLGPSDVTRSRGRRRFRSWRRERVRACGCLLG